MGYDASRRRLLLTLGASSAALAGCFHADVDPSGGDVPGDDDGGGDDGNEDDGRTVNDEEDGEEPSEEISWPAIETGELLSDFREEDPWEAMRGSIERSSDEALVGSEALDVEVDDDQAVCRLFFPDGLDLEGWDASMAVKAESIDRIAIEFLMPEFGHHLASFRVLPNDHDDWLRVDFGYTEKQGDPDRSNVTEIRVFGFGPEDGPTRFVIDDLRRTEAVDNGKAILACYGGLDSHYEIAGELLDERGWAAAVAMDPRRIDGGGRMGLDELRELQDRGWDICPAPRGSDGLSGLPEEDQRSVLTTARNSLDDRGFSEGARHFFAPDWREMDPTNDALVRELFETGFVFGGGTCGLPPTSPHMIPMIWGPALHSGVRRHINLADQFQVCTVLRIPRIVENEDDVDANSMSLEDFEHLLNHIEHRGLNVITPSDIVDGTMDGGSQADQDVERPEGTILEAGQSHSFDGSESGESDEFDLEGGVLVGEFSHDGSGDFGVTVTPVDGDLPNDLFVRTSGSTSGESLILVGEGSYGLDVEADGDWEIDLTQPEVHSDDLTDLPQEASGTGSSFVGPLWTDTDPSLVATHQGDGEFIVDGYGADGSWEQIINQSGEFDGSRSYSAAGTFWLNVEADGEWTIEIND